MKRRSRRIIGTKERPRLAVFKSLNNIYAQIIDDVESKTIVQVGTLDKKISKEIKKGGNIEAAKVVGEEIARRAQEKKIKKVVFDKRSFLFHGRVKALADSARAGGLEF